MKLAALRVAVVLGAVVRATAAAQAVAPTTPFNPAVAAGRPAYRRA